MKNSFVLYNDYRKHLTLLNDTEKARLLDAIFAYADGEQVELDGVVEMAFSFIKAQMDRDAEKYADKCEKRREAGLKGGAPKGNKNASKQPKQANGCINNQNNQKQAKQPDTDNDTDNDNDNVTDINKGINYQEIVDLYNNTCVSLPRVSALSDSRKKSIRARLKKYSVEDLKKAFLMAERSDFLKGANNRNWSANFDWIMNDTNIAKILDGNYSSKGNKIEMDQNFRNFLSSNEVVDFGNMGG